MAPSANDQAEWPEAMAEVTACVYDVRAGRALAFGLTTKKHFRITYNYRVGDALHTGECFAEKAMPQGMLFPIRYDPNLPRQHHSDPSRQGSNRKLAVPLLAIGIAGSVILSLAWLLFLRGCS